MKQTRLPWPALLALAILSLIWGYNWVVMKEGLRFSGPLAFVALRSLLGASVLFPTLWARGRPLAPRSLWAALILGFLQIIGFLGLATWALVNGNAGKTAVLAYTMPLWLLVLGWPILGERLRGMQWLAIALALAGLLLVAQPWLFHPQLYSIILAILSGVLWALSSIWVKKLPPRLQEDLLSLNAWQMLLGGIPLLFLSLWLEPRPVWTTYFIEALLYSGIPGMALAWVSWLYALRELPAGIAGMDTLFIPLVGVIAAWLQLGEAPPFSEGVGMALIISGLGVLNLSKIHGNPKP